MTCRADTLVEDICDAGFMGLTPNFCSKIDLVAGRTNARTDD
jgi:hypothetical protein